MTAAWSFHQPPVGGSTANRNDAGIRMTEHHGMKKRLFIALIVFALLVLAALGAIIGTGGD